MVGDRTIGGRTTVASLGLALIVATAAFGALLGATLPNFRSVDEISLLVITAPISPLTLAVYGAVAMGSFLVALGYVVQILSRFDDDAV
uniref:Cox cluster protein n=1 Tax=Natrinema halophilum TaxID=1699371 RepID=A0A7D5KG20_9EURY